MSLGTAERASSPKEATVGVAITAKMTAAFIKLRPVAKPRTFWRNGAITAMPMSPSTTEGTEAKSSTAGFTSSLVDRPATQAR